MTYAVAAPEVYAGDSGLGHVKHPKALFAVARVSGDATGADFAVFFGGYSDPGTPEVEGTDDSARVLYVSEAG